MLELAGLRRPVTSVAEIDLTVSEPLAALVENLSGVATTISDRILTPLRWNSLSETIYGHSRHRLPADRNELVRAIVDPKFAALLGTNREDFISRAVGMFRLNCSSERPSPLLGAVYEKIKLEPLFLNAWNQRLVCRDLSEKSVTVRNHAVAGRLAMYAADLGTLMNQDLLLGTLIPADAESAAKFERLANLARAAENSRSSCSPTQAYKTSEKGLN